MPQDGETASDPVLEAIAELMKSSEVVAFLEAVTGVEDPHFVDGQVTAYGQGDFLTGTTMTW